MLYQITWASYFEIVFLLLVPYYLVILYKYYWYDLLNLFTGNKNLQNDGATAPAGNQEPVSTNGIAAEAGYTSAGNYEIVNPGALQGLKDELQAFFSSAGNQNIPRKQLLASLRALMEKYGPLKSSSYKNMIENLVIQECETHCSVHLGDDELEGIWPG